MSSKEAGVTHLSPQEAYLASPNSCPRSLLNDSHINRRFSLEGLTTDFDPENRANPLVNYNFLTKSLKERSQESRPSSPRTTADLLLVDDDDFVMSLLKTFALRADLTFDVARNGEEGLQKILQASSNGRCSYGLIILDNHMPLMTGVDLCKQLRRLNIEANIALHSAHSNYDEKNDYYNAGFHQTLQKPASWSDIQELLTSSPRD